MELARQHGAVVRCVRLTADARLAEHNDAFRAFNAAHNPEQRHLLPRVAFASFASRFQMPTPEEGFDEITTEAFCFDGTEAERALWSQAWI